jgi:hypothetical protein
MCLSMADRHHLMQDISSSLYYPLSDIVLASLDRPLPKSKG